MMYRARRWLGISVFGSKARYTRHRQTLRPVLEMLENRLAPAVVNAGGGSAAIYGNVWNDLNGNGSLNAGEPSLAGAQVYLDLNQNGKLDSGEPALVTDATGNYGFTGLTPGTYQVGVLPPSGWVQTSPLVPRVATATLPPAVWQPLGPNGGDVTTVAVSPTNPSVVLAGINPDAYHGTLYRSADGGANWLEVPAFHAASQNSTNGLSVNALTFAADGTAYAGTQWGLYKSSDGGINWTALNLNIGIQENVMRVAVNPANSSEVWAGVNDAIGSQPENLLRSTDGGASWANVTPPLGQAMSGLAIAFDPSDPTHVFAGFGGGFGGGQFWYSPDDGASWVNYSGGLPGAPVRDIVDDGTHVYVTGGLLGRQNLGLYVSSDNGADWQQLSSSTWPSLVGRALAEDPNNPAVLLLASEGDGVFRSTDRGQTWSFGVNGTAGQTFNAVTFAPGSSSNVFTGSTSFAVEKSTDGGVDFSASSQGVVALNSVFQAVNPTNPNELAVAFSALNSGGIYTSTDDGQTWSLTQAPATRWNAVGFAPDGTLYGISAGPVLVAQEGLYRRNADGSWTDIGPNLGPNFELNLQTLTFSRTNPNVILTGGQQNGSGNHAVIYRTNDGGATWSQVYISTAGEDNIQDIEFLPDGTDQTVLAGYTNLGGSNYAPVPGGVLRSTDDGVTWAASSTGLSPSNEITRIAASPLHSNLVYAADDDLSLHPEGGVFVSTDGGQTWANAGKTGAVQDITVDPNDDRILYIAEPNSAKLERSQDGGATFQPFAQGLELVPDLYSNFHLTYAPGVVPRLLLSTWKGEYATDLYSTPGSLSVTVSDGQTSSGNNFGNQALPAGIQGKVFLDDGNGVYDGYEQGQAGWTVFLDTNGNGKLDPGEPFSISDANGNYSFSNLAPGTYTVTLQMQPGWRQDVPASPGRYTDTVSAGQQVTGDNLGFVSLPTEIHGTLFDDLNGNGVQDPGEPGLAGLTVFIDQNGNGKLDPNEQWTRTDAQGNYAFTGLNPGTYLISVAGQPYFKPTAPGYGNTLTASTSSGGNELNLDTYSIQADGGSSSGGSATRYAWQDQDPSTSNVIDIWYDFRPQNGYANQITPAEETDVQAALQMWSDATGGRIKFTQNTTAPASQTINIGTGDLAAVGYTSGPYGVLGAGGGVFSQSGGANIITNGVAWMDYAETWDTGIGDGDPNGGIDFFTVVAHEIGHALGLGHTFNLPWHNIMDPTYEGEQTGLSGVDADRLRGLYGSANDATPGMYIVALNRGDISTGISFGEQPRPIPFTPLNLDFGTATSPVAAGFTQAADQTIYNPSTGGYGWENSQVQSVDRGTGTDLERDFVETNVGTFVADVPDGVYQVTVTLGDSAAAHNNQTIYLQGVYQDTVSTAAGAFYSHTYSVTVTNHQLNLVLWSQDGSEVAIDALQVAAASPALTLSENDTAISEAGGTTTGTVTRNNDFDVSLTVALQSSGSAAGVPASVTIPAGQTSASFTITAADDGIYNGTQKVTISASAAGYSNGTVALSVTESDPEPTLTVAIAPGTISESGGSATGTVTRSSSADVSQALTVTLANSNTGAASVPATVTIPVGKSSANFTINAIDDGLYNGDQTDTVTASANNYITGSNTLKVTESDPIPTSATVATSKSSTVYGQVMTFTATISSSYGTPTGSVSFDDGTTVLGSGTLDSTGKATFSIASLDAGTHSITAVYKGDGTYGGSTASAVTQTVSADATSTSLTSPATSAVYSQSVTFTATVVAAAPGTITPSGTVTFKDGSTALGTASLNNSGKATYATSALAVGGHTITAVYNGTSDFNKSTSSAVSENITKDNTSVDLTSSLNPDTSGTAVTFTATVTANSPGTGVPDGTITFMDGKKKLAVVTLDSSGLAKFTISTLSRGKHSITAVYSGSGSFNGSTSAVLLETVK